MCQLTSQGHGELLVSICHHPAASRLTVVVLKARDLPKMDITGLAGINYDNVEYINLQCYFSATFSADGR